jgi:lysophospholipase L1-like esterase
MRRCVQWCAGVLRASGRYAAMQPRRPARLPGLAISCQLGIEKLESRVFLSSTPMAIAQTRAVVRSSVTLAGAASSQAFGKAGVAAKLSVLGADPAGESTLTYTWRAIGPAAVTLSSNRSNLAKNTTATFAAAGEYIFTVTISDKSGASTTSTTDYTVNHKETAIVIKPARATVAEGNARRFVATAYDQFLHVLAKQPQFQWSVASGGAGGTITSTSGAYTAPASRSGTDTVIATDARGSRKAVVTVVASSATASISESQAPAASSYNLDQLGTADWAHWGRDGILGNVDRSATGGSQISDVTPVGAGTVGAFSDSTRIVTWTEGTPTENEAADDGYIYNSDALGAGFAFTVPAEATPRTLLVYAGGFESGAQLTAHLSDGSAPDSVISSSATGKYTSLYTITYSAASAGQTLTISYVKNQTINGVAGGSVDLIAAMLAGGSGTQTHAAPLTIMPLGDSITVGVGINGATSSSPNYRLPLYNDLTAAGIPIQYEGANDPSNADSSQIGYCPALSNIGENQNNGYAGYTSGDILANLAGSQAPVYYQVVSNQGGYWLTGGGGTARTAQYPNIVTLMIGTNDALVGVPLGSPTTAGSLEGNVTAILQWFAANRPATEVIVATPITNANPTVNAEITAYGSWLTSAVPTYSNDRLVNVNPLFTNSDGSPNTSLLQSDGIHPTETGYADIATALAGAIESSIETN